MPAPRRERRRDAGLPQSLIPRRPGFPRESACLGPDCNKLFRSTGRGHRMCEKCRKSVGRLDDGRPEAAWIRRGGF